MGEIVEIAPSILLMGTVSRLSIRCEKALFDMLVLGEPMLPLDTAMTRGARTFAGRLPLLCGPPSSRALQRQVCRIEDWSRPARDGAASSSGVVLGHGSIYNHASVPNLAAWQFSKSHRYAAMLARTLFNRKAYRRVRVTRYSPAQSLSAAWAYQELKVLPP